MVEVPPDFQTFRADREAELTEPYGWLTLLAFHWVPTDAAPLANLPGLWWVEGSQERACVSAAALDGLTVNGVPVDGVNTLDVAEYGRVPWVDIGLSRVELLRRGGRLAVRVRSSSSPERDTFTHVPSFDYDPAWRIIGRFTPYADQREIEVASIRPDLRQIARPFGEVTFTIGGAPQRLAVTKGKYGWGVEFHDPTNGDLTEQWRQLHFTPPASGGEGDVELDFNRSLNMWFAFTQYATCPAPIAGNEITVPVLAGERRASSDECFSGVPNSGV